MLKKICLILLGCLALFFVGYRLTESPPTWMDEGIIIQSARSVAQNGVFGLPEAPGQFVTGSFLTTGYPVVYPIALVFKLAGVGLFQARLVMAAYILLLLVLVYFLALKINGNNWFSLTTLALLVTFAPLYGQGRNVLGEVPGIFFMLVSIWCWYWLADRPSKWLASLAGVSLGLALVTKPTFLPLLPAGILTIALFIYRRQLSWAQSIWTMIGAIIPLIIFYFAQLSSESFAQILAFYSNPHAVSLVEIIKANIYRLTTELESVYCLLLLLVWWSSLVGRWYLKQSVKSAEIGAALASSFLMLAYLQTVGYYRYFLAPEILGLIYLPSSLKWWCEQFSSLIVRRVMLIGLFILIVFQFNQSVFYSWVAKHYASQRAASLTTYFKQPEHQQTYFLYQAPVAATFLGNKDYYQYLLITPKVIIGGEWQNNPPADVSVVLPQDLDLNNLAWAEDYETVDLVDQFRILEPKY
ncbi:MAG: glycosyltransferase family 39 protein [Candidatus Vogelbacteria bacterium]|nr:glycosyltransferase family 39 protein [Candidatus Vogelbacteria bacterium]